MDFARKSMKGQQGGERGEGGANFHLQMAVMTSILYGWGLRERTCSYNAGFLLSILHWCKIVLITVFLPQNLFILKRNMTTWGCLSTEMPPKGMSDC